MGRTKIPFDQLFYLSRNELDIIIKGHEIDQKEIWEMVRVHASIGIQPHLKKGINVTPEKLIPLPWDKKRVRKQVPQEKIEKAKKLGEIVRQKRIKARENGGSKD